MLPGHARLPGRQELSALSGSGRQYLAPPLPDFFPRPREDSFSGGLVPRVDNLFFLHGGPRDEDEPALRLLARAISLSGLRSCLDSKDSIFGGGDSSLTAWLAPSPRLFLLPKLALFPSPPSVGQVCGKMPPSLQSHPGPLLVKESSTLRSPPLDFSFPIRLLLVAIPPF